MIIMINLVGVMKSSVYEAVKQGYVIPVYQSGIVGTFRRLLTQGRWTYFLATLSGECQLQMIVSVSGETKPMTLGQH